MLKRRIAGLLLSTGCAFGLADRISEGSRVEGPSHTTEVFYLSVNRYDAAGDRHDDRAGDAFLTGICLGALMAIVPRRELLSTAPDPISADTL